MKERLDFFLIQFECQVNVTYLDFRDVCDTWFLIHALEHHIPDIVTPMRLWLMTWESDGV